MWIFLNITLLSKRILLIYTIISFIHFRKYTFMSMQYSHFYILSWNLLHVVDQLPSSSIIVTNYANARFAILDFGCWGKEMGDKTNKFAKSELSKIKIGIWWAAATSPWGLGPGFKTVMGRPSTYIYETWQLHDLFMFQSCSLQLLIYEVGKCRVITASFIFQDIPFLYLTMCNQIPQQFHMLFGLV